MNPSSRQSRSVVFHEFARQVSDLRRFTGLGKIIVGYLPEHAQSLPHATKIRGWHDYGLARSSGIIPASQNLP
jgi:hypothetical protein